MRGGLRVPRRVFQRLPPERPTPERCVEAYYLQRTRSEGIAERTLSGAPIDRGWEYRDQRAGLAAECQMRAVAIARECLNSTQAV